MKRALGILILTVIFGSIFTQIALESGVLIAIGCFAGSIAITSLIVLAIVWIVQ